MREAKKALPRVLHRQEWKTPNKRSWNGQREPSEDRRHSLTVFTEPREKFQSPVDDKLFFILRQFFLASHSEHCIVAVSDGLEEFFPRFVLLSFESFTVKQKKTKLNKLAMTRALLNLLCSSFVKSSKTKTKIFVKEKKFPKCFFGRFETGTKSPPKSPLRLQMKDDPPTTGV